MSLGHPVFVAVVYLAALMRVVRSVNHDTVWDAVRIKVAQRGRDEARSEAERARWNTLLHWSGCPWCVSPWVAASTVWLPIWFADNPVVRYVGLVLAASMVVGLLARWSSDDEISYESA